ncbi:MAG: hypothetical protein WC799_13185 [Desulfobacteraceae bacterium]|jgi:hypothetical protein
MYFNIKRYLYGMAKRKWIGLFIFIIPMLFLVISAILPDRYTVAQNVEITNDAPVALMTDPVGFMTFKQLSLEPESFFLNSYSLTKLTSDIMTGWAEKYGAVIGDMIKESMGLIRLDGRTVQIVYTGKSREIGEILVGFYADRLVKKANEGITRSNTSEFLGKPALSGSIEIREMKAMWRSDRMGPFLYCIGASVVLVLLLFGFIEWNDSSLKSERQIARYIGLPILGNIPDLNKVALVLHSKGQ